MTTSVRLLATLIIAALAGVTAAPLSGRAPESTRTALVTPDAVPSVHRVRANPGASKPPLTIGHVALTAMVKRSCGGCHSDRRMAGNLSLESFDVAQASKRAEVTEGIMVSGGKGDGDGRTEEGSEAGGDPLE